MTDHQLMRISRARPPGRRLFCCLLLLPLLTAAASAQEMVLDYLYRFDHPPVGPFHIMNAIEVSDNRAIVSSNQGLTLIDLAALPPEGTTDTLSHLPGLNARDIRRGDGGVFYVNVHRSGAVLGNGLATVRLNGGTLELSHLIVDEGLMLEKMHVDGDWLYVASHAHGLRVYSLANPLVPAFVVGLETGFVDAYAVTVVGTTAYVADGAGGLKVVDVGTPSAPELLVGETLETAVGTAEDITQRGGNVYVALGGAGLGFYPGGDPAHRQLVTFEGCAESMCWIGDHLVVGTIDGVVVFDVSGAVPEIVGGEVAARRGPSASLRITSGVNEASGNRLLCSNWDYLDVYQLKDFAEGNQPDISPSRQRIRFAPAGGTQHVTLSNNGAQPLTIYGVSCTNGAFTCDYAGGAILPGESVSCRIDYTDHNANASGLVRFSSNDPDESPLPIQVFGRTNYLDPGEIANDFTLPVISRNHETGEFNEEMFTLSDQQGKVVWFQVFGTW